MFTTVCCMQQTDKKKISMVSLFFETFPYRLNESTGTIDYDTLEENAKLYRPKVHMQYSRTRAVYTHTMCYGCTRCVQMSRDCAECTVQSVSWPAGAAQGG